MSKEGKDWDQLLPYLLFAYREVPQSSTGFSPFELLYGRTVKVVSSEFYFHKPITVHIELYLFYRFIHFLLYIGQY